MPLIFTGSIKGNQIKHGKKQVVFDENKRKTYKQSHPSVGGREPSVLTTFDGERKQLLAVRITLMLSFLFNSLMMKLMLLKAMHEILVNEGGSVCNKF